MPSVKSVLHARRVETEHEIDAAIAPLHLWGWLTRTQTSAVAQAVVPHLPCYMMIDMRTRKGMVYLRLVRPDSLFHVALRLDHRGRVLGEETFG